MKVILVNSADSMRGGETQTLEIGLRLIDGENETAFAVKTGSELAAVIPERIPKLELDFETPPSISPIRMRKFIKNWNPDIVHAQTSKAHTHALLACSRLVPLIVSRRAAFSGSSGFSASLKYGRGVAHYIPISIAAADSLRKRGVPEEKMTLVHSGVDVEKYFTANREKAVRDELGAAEGQILAGTVAAFEREKGHSVLLEAASILDSKGLRIRYALAGSGSLEESISSEISNLGIDAGIFTIGEGYTLESFLKSLDIYILPSIEEGLSTGLVAAMAAGLPCIASRTGGIPEVTGNDCAEIFEPGNPTALASAIERLVFDPVLREEYSIKAAKRAEMFDIEITVKKTMDVYRRVLGEY
jgi:glycosyltransferase involved in cell wall biosynthesis